MIDIGRLNKRITFFGPIVVKNEKTHMTSKQMGELRTVWASVEAKSGSRYKDVEADKNRVIWDVYIRKAKQLDKAQGMEIHWNGRVLRIDASLPTKDGDMIHFLCTEVIQ